MYKRNENQKISNEMKFIKLLIKIVLIKIQTCEIFENQHQARCE